MHKLNLIVCLALILTASARGDSWMPPRTIVVHSRDGNIVVRIDPGFGEEGERARSMAVATVTRWSGEDRSYHFVRRVTLRNPRSPVTAVITNDARFLVTFDDWGGLGTTENTVVIYDLDNSRVHNQHLREFLPERLQGRFVRTAGSINWREQPFVNESNQTVWIPLKGMVDPHAEVDLVRDKVTIITLDEDNK